MATAPNTIMKPGAPGFTDWFQAQQDKQGAYIDRRRRYREAHGFAERKSGAGLRA